MATPFSIPGLTSLGNIIRFYNRHRSVCFKFYSDASTMLRIDGNIRDTAAAMLLKDFNSRQKFVETFFLAPQERGYFVLNDVFHYIEEDRFFHHTLVYLTQSNLDLKLNVPTAVQEPANYLLSEEIQAREFMSQADVQENGQVENYGFPEERLQKVHDSERILEDPAEVNGSLQLTVESVQDHLPTSVDEPVEEPQKHTYASILLLSLLSTGHTTFFRVNHIPESTVNKVTVSSNTIERSGTDTTQDYSAVDEEDEIRSVYMKNLSPSMTKFEIEEEFKKFGKICPEGVVIRSRKVIGVCYTFIEFEDMSGVHNAVEAGSALIAGRQVYIEERRPNSYVPSRAGRGRGRGRGSSQTEASRGCSVSRRNGLNGDDQDYNSRSRGGNGYYKLSSRQYEG